MNTTLKKALCLILSAVLLVSNVVVSLADTPGNSNGSGISSITPGGKGYIKNPLPIYRDYGFRVTIADSSQLQGTI